MSSAFCFPSDVDEFKNHAAEDAAAFFANITALLRQFQQHAQNAEVKKKTTPVSSNKATVGSKACAPNGTNCRQPSPPPWGTKEGPRRHLHLYLHLQRHPRHLPSVKLGLSKYRNPQYSTGLELSSHPSPSNYNPNSAPMRTAFEQKQPKWTMLSAA